MRSNNQNLQFLLVILFVLLLTSSKAQIVAGESFMQGSFLEIGISTCGSYGTRASAPAGYHPRNNFNRGMGFAADQERNGWTVGSPNYCGDYFLPGAPVEGWGIEFDSAYFLNSNLGTICTQEDITGSILSYRFDGVNHTTVWQGSVTHGGKMLTINQTTILPDTGLYFITNVTLTNTSGFPMNNVFYGRNVDPDNDIMQSSLYTTRNQIVSQPNSATCRALVSTNGTRQNCYLALGTVASNSRVSVGGFYTQRPSNVYNGYLLDTAVGSAFTADVAVSLAYYWPVLLPGQSVSVSYMYLLNPDDLEEAISSLGNPTILANGVNISANPTDTICPGELETLSINYDSTFTWTWSPASAVSSTTGNTTTVTATAPVMITATGHNGGCASISKNIYIHVDTVNRIQNGNPDIVLCGPGMVNLRPFITYDTLFPTIAPCDSYMVMNIPFLPYDTTSSTIINLTADNQLSTALPIGFNFKFYCNYYKNAYLSTNGYISFDAGAGSGCCAGQLLPNSRIPNNMIAFAYEDLAPVPGASVISYKTIGTAPYRKFIVNMYNVVHSGGVDPVSAQIVLNETDNSVDIFTTTMPGNPYGTWAAHTMGLENSNGTKGFAYPGRNASTTWTATNEGVRFYPAVYSAPAVPLRYSWLPAGTFTGSSSAMPSYSALSNVSIPFSVTDGHCSTISDTLDIVIQRGDTTTANYTVCYGDTLILQGRSYYSAGSYFDTLVSSAYCDSFVRVNITSPPARTSTITRYMCQGDTILVADTSFSVAGTFIRRFSSPGLCDSVLTVNIRYYNNRINRVLYNVCSTTPITIGTSVYTHSGIFYDTLISTHGCDSIIITTINHFPSPVIFQNISICTGGSFTIGSHTYTTPGVYEDTLMTIYGCDSFLVTTLTINPTSTSTQSFTICNGDSVVVGSSVYRSSGIYTDHLVNVYRCDSTVITTVNILPSYNQFVEANICNGELYNYNGNHYSSNVFISDTFQTIYGCDSIYSFSLFVHPNFNTSNPQTICEGSSYSIGTSSYSIAGSYFDTLTSSAGCDSVVNTILNIINTVITSHQLSICDGEMVSVGAHSYNATGVYYDTLTSSAGCDSVVITNLEVKPVFRSVMHAEICVGESYTFNGSSYNATNVYFDTLTSSNGCDSLIELHLIVHPEHFVTINVHLCAGESRRTGSSVYTTAGSFYDTLQTIYGCDSIVNTNITVGTINTVFYNFERCEGDFVSVGSRVYTESGIYRDTLTNATGCDSIIVRTITYKPVHHTVMNLDICKRKLELYRNKYTHSGIYLDTFSNTYGCDSFVTTNVRIYSPEYIYVDSVLCVGSTYLGRSMYSDTTMVQVFLAYDGCDSVEVVHRINVIENTALQVGPDRGFCAGTSVTLTAEGGIGWYKWYGPAELSCSECAVTTIANAEPGLYLVQSGTCEGDTQVASLILTQLHNPTITLTASDSSVVKGQSVQIQAQTAPGNTINWFNADGQICRECASLTYRPQEEKYISVVVTSPDGCESKDSILLQVTKGCSSESIEAPNFISDNHDGANDKFSFRNPMNLNIAGLEIYDRWGEKVFSSTDVNSEWDGTYLGKPLPVGVYTYMIKGSCPQSVSFLKTGSITIIR